MNKYLIISICILLMVFLFILHIYRTENASLKQDNANKDVIISSQEAKIKKTLELQKMQNDITHTEKVKKDEDCSNMFVSIPSKCLR